MPAGLVALNRSRRAVPARLEAKPRYKASPGTGLGREGKHLSTAPGKRKSSQTSWTAVVLAPPMPTLAATSSGGAITRSSTVSKQTELGAAGEPTWVPLRTVTGWSRTADSQKVSFARAAQGGYGLTPMSSKNFV